VPITILRAQASAGCLFFGKIGSGRGLVRSHFFFPAKEKRRLRQEKSRAPVLPPVRRRFTSTKSHAIDAEARGGRGPSGASASACGTIRRHRRGGHARRGAQALELAQDFTPDERPSRFMRLKRFDRHGFSSCPTRHEAANGSNRHHLAATCLKFAA
jgi:hypothetical protein